MIPFKGFSGVTALALCICTCRFGSCGEVVQGGNALMQYRFVTQAHILYQMGKKSNTHGCLNGRQIRVDLQTQFSAGPPVIFRRQWILKAYR